MEDKLISILLEQEDFTWKDIIFNLIKNEDLDPWDIDVSKLASKFLKIVKKLEGKNLRLSGKVLLAAAILLRIKSTRLVGEDLLAFDNMFAKVDEDELLYGTEEDTEYTDPKINLEDTNMRLIPRTPQPRKRKVSVYELVDALAIALNVTRRRIRNKFSGPEVKIPEKSKDITQLMDEVYSTIYEQLYGSEKSMRFTQLLPSNKVEDKVLTFIPLLHLSNNRKVDLTQEPNEISDFDITLTDD